MNQTQENNKEQSVFGLTIHLKKCILGKATRGIQGEPNIILGHYDSILITPISKWLEYSNVHPLKNTNLTDPSSFYVKCYPIRLLFPSDTIIRKYPSFHYKEWKKYEDLLKKNRCMTLVLVNLTDEYKRSVQNDLLDNFLDIVSNYKEIQTSLENVHFVILPSIGYSDFCVLMCSEKWDQPMKLVEFLHGLTNEKNTPVISTDYMIPVYHFNGNCEFNDNCFSDIGMSVRVNIKPGITAHMLKENIPKEVEVYRTSGSTDCLLRAKGDEIAQLFKFLISSKTNTKTGFIVDMESTLQLPITDIYAKSKNIYLSDTPIKDIDLRNLGTLIEDYNKILEKNKKNRQQINDLYELLTNIENIYAEYHTEAVCCILRGFIKNLSFCLGLCINDLKNENPEYNLDEIEEQIHELCSIVNEFLLDLSRSDCFFIEKERYNHSSVSSITSLLIAYNQWLNAFTNKVQSATQPENKSDFKFLVTSGNQNQTVTFNPFYFLNHNIDRQEIPLIILMSDISPFDFSGTILRAVHECMHFCGERYRKERVNYLVSFVTMMLAQNMSEVIFPAEQMSKYIQEIYTTLCPDAYNREEILNKAKRICYDCSVRLTEAIQKVLEKCFDKETFISVDENCLLKNVKGWIYNTLLKAFSVYVFDDGKDKQIGIQLNDFFADIYDEIQKVYIKLIEKNIALATDNNIDTLIFSFELDKIKLYLNYTNECEMDILIKNQIQLILSRLLIDIPIYADISYSKDWEYSFPYYSLTQKNILDVLDIATDIFSETFSDVMACKILNATLEDYLLAYIYEELDLDRALPLEETKIYRISAVINTCFKEQLNKTKLSEEACQKINAAILKLTAHGMPAMVDYKELCRRVNCLLNLFNQNKLIGEPLMQYLEYCIVQYKSKDIFTELNCFSKSFNKIKLLNVIPNESDTNEKLIQMYYALINNTWSKEDEGNDGDKNESEMREVVKTR